MEVNASDVGVGAVLSQRLTEDQKLRFLRLFLLQTVTCREELQNWQL